MSAATIKELRVEISSNPQNAALIELWQSDGVTGPPNALRVRIIRKGSAEERAGVESFVEFFVWPRELRALRQATTIFFQDEET